MLVYLGIATVLFSFLQVVGGRTICPQHTHFTVYDPTNPHAKETCRRCPECPTGEGLPIQCGSRVAAGISTDCQPCKANETYSDGNDSSHCKPCNLCGSKQVVQHCTPQQNRKCGSCLPGHFLEPVLDECMECSFCCPGVPESARLQQCKDLGMPESRQCQKTKANIKCEQEAKMMTTSTPATDVPGNKSTAVTTGSVGTGIVATNATATDSNNSQPVPSNESQTITEAAAEDHGSIDKDSKHLQCIIGGSVGAFLVLVGIIICIALKRRHCNRKIQIYNTVEQGEDQVELKEFPIRKSQLSNIDGKTTPLLKNQSADSSATSSTESIRDSRNEATTHKNVDVDVQRIPEVRLVSDMEWLRDVDGVSRMLFCVQKELDLRESSQKRTWRSVGLALDVSANELDMINTFCYQAEKSPTERLLDLFKTRGNEEPTMRKFVVALIACDRKDIACTICNWPWELEENKIPPS